MKARETGIRKPALQERYTDEWYPFESDLPPGGMTPTSKAHAAETVAFHEKHVSQERAEDHGIGRLLEGWGRHGHR